MSSAQLAVFVFLAFIVPVPLLHWLDRPRLAPPEKERAGKDAQARTGEGR